MLWAGTPGVGLGPRHIDWGPGGCARRSLLFGHSLNVSRVATAAAAAATAGVPTTTLVVALKTMRHTRPLEPMNTLIKLVSKFDERNSKTVVSCVVYGFRLRHGRSVPRDTNSPPGNGLYQLRFTISQSCRADIHGTSGIAACRYCTTTVNH